MEKIAPKKNSSAAHSALSRGAGGTGLEKIPPMGYNLCVIHPKGGIITEHFEIERKFLIRKPDESALLAQAGCRKIEISQTYLASGDGTSARVRKSVCDGACTYTRTEKRRISDIKRIEIEEEITEEEYLRALADRDPELRAVEKVRYKIPDGKLTWEIDVFPFWERQAYLEVELDSEDEGLELPAYVEVIREVTDDRRYTNRALAREVPEEG